MTFETPPRRAWLSAVRPWELAGARFSFALSLIGAAVAGVLSREYPPFDAADRFSRHDGVGTFLVGLAAGAVGGWLLPHRYRAAGILPVVGGFWLAAAGYSATTGVWSGWPHGLPAGVAVVVSGRFLAAFPAPYGRAVGLLAWLAFAACLAAAFAPLWSHEVRSWGGAALVGLTLALTLVSAVTLRRPFVETLLELPTRVAYRLTAVGPGVGACPARGPCLVIANHAAYLDPLFLAAVIARPITPLMTSMFYDRPVIRQLMVYIFDTIRVPEAALKRDAGELTAAVAALDAGKCVVIFPEGYLRRKEDQPLRRFGRGVWEILRARPDTPVVACWIEGNWGSYFSHRGGPPTQNKPVDFRRPIGIGVAAPEAVPAGVLAHHLDTRFHLMNLVLAARSPLGLPELPVAQRPTPDDALPG